MQEGADGSEEITYETTMIDGAVTDRQAVAYNVLHCTIPYARGRSRSGVIADLVNRARMAAGEGAKEIVITGVNIGEFGSDNGQSFFDLIRELDTVQGIERYRISSIEPNLLTDEIIDWVAQSRAFMPHFHIPLQSGSDRVLS